MADGKDGKILSVTSYQNRGIQIRNHALIKIEEEKKFKITTGAFCGIGVEEKGLISSFILLEKVVNEDELKRALDENKLEDLLDRNKLEVKEITDEEIKTNSNFDKLDRSFKGLFKIRRNNRNQVDGFISREEMSF